MKITIQFHDTALFIEKYAELDIDEEGLELEKFFDGTFQSFMDRVAIGMREVIMQETNNAQTSTANVQDTVDAPRTTAI